MSEELTIGVRESLREEHACTYLLRCVKVHLEH